MNGPHVLPEQELLEHLGWDAWDPDDDWPPTFMDPRLFTPAGEHAS